MTIYKAAHTPGPWIVYQPNHSTQVQIRDEAGEMIIAVVPEKGNPPRAMADARVLAEAPVMRETILALLALLNRLSQDLNWGGAHLRAETIQALNEQPSKARALLARIDG